MELTDADFINAGIIHAEDQRKVIADHVAYMIAACIHGGEDTAIYKFASTGHIMLEHIEWELRVPLEDPEAQRWGQALLAYVRRDAAME